MLKVKGVMVDEKRHIRFADWSATDVSLISTFLYIRLIKYSSIPFSPFFQIEVLNKYLFLTSKPVIYLINLSEKDYVRKKNKW